MKNHNNKPGHIKVKFSANEDEKLIGIVTEIGDSDWVKVASRMKTRNPRQCRERWNNYLNPELNVEPWTKEEDEILLKKHKEFGGRWSKIGMFLKGRSDNAIKNRYMQYSRKPGKRIGSVNPSRFSKRSEEGKIDASDFFDLVFMDMDIDQYDDLSVLY